MNPRPGREGHKKIVEFFPMRASVLYGVGGNKELNVMPSINFGAVFVVAPDFSRRLSFAARPNGAAATPTPSIVSATTNRPSSPNPLPSPPPPNHNRHRHL